MAKEVAGLIKLQVKGGAANPPPPVGPILGSKGINIMGLYEELSTRTQDKTGKIILVTITCYTDKSLDFVLKTPPVAVQLKEVAKLKTVLAQPNRQKVTSVTWDQVRTTAKDKVADLNCLTVESAMRFVAGTARSTGITVKGELPGDN